MTEPIRPSEVQKFSRCPTLWHREDVEGWRKPGDQFVLEREFGTWVHAGLAAYWRLIRDGYGELPESAALRACPPGYDEQGIKDLLVRVVNQTTGWLQTKMERAVPVLIEQELLHTGTPDLVAREPDLTVTDYKTHFELAKDRLVYRVEGPERVHQFQHYIWATGEHLQEPVRQFRVLHIVALPKIIIQAVLFTPSPEAQAEWLRQAKRKWYTMAQMRIEPKQVYRREEGCMIFGEKHPCPQYEGCWTCHGKEEYLKQFYAKEP